MNVTVLDPCAEPKFVPVIVTPVPTEPEVGDRFVMVGPVPGTLKFTPLLNTPLKVSTTTFPSVAAEGTFTVSVFDHVPLTVAGAPLKKTVPGVLLKFVPWTVTEVPGAPVVGDTLVMFGAGNQIPLLEIPFTVITMFPSVAPVGSVA